jgi:hypothetical protein
MSLKILYIFKISILYHKVKEKNILSNNYYQINPDSALANFKRKIKVKRTVP